MQEEEGSERMGVFFAFPGLLLASRSRALLMSVLSPLDDIVLLVQAFLPAEGWRQVEEPFSDVVEL